MQKSEVKSDQHVVMINPCWYMIKWETFLSKVKPQTAFKLLVQGVNQFLLDIIRSLHNSSQSASIYYYLLLSNQVKTIVQWKDTWYI